MAAKFCWQCGRDLTYYHKRLLFAEVTDQLGAVHRVHKACVTPAEKEIKGKTAVPPFTAYDSRY